MVTSDSRSDTVRLGIPVQFSVIYSGLTTTIQITFKLFGNAVLTAKQASSKNTCQSLILIVWTRWRMGHNHFWISGQVCLVWVPSWFGFGVGIRTQTFFNWLILCFTRRLRPSEIIEIIIRCCSLESTRCWWSLFGSFAFICSVQVWCSRHRVDRWVFSINWIIIWFCIVQSWFFFWSWHKHTFVVIKLVIIWYSPSKMIKISCWPIWIRPKWWAVPHGTLAWMIFILLWTGSICCCIISDSRAHFMTFHVRHFVRLLARPVDGI